MRKKNSYMEMEIEKGIEKERPKKNRETEEKKNKERLGYEGKISEI